MANSQSLHKFNPEKADNREDEKQVKAKLQKAISNGNSAVARFSRKRLLERAEMGRKARVESMSNAHLLGSVTKNVRTLSGLARRGTRGCAQSCIVGAVSIGPFELSR
jgi:hypothetical protein